MLRIAPSTVIFAAALLAANLGCKSESQSGSAASEASGSPPAAQHRAGVEAFGAPLSGAPAKALADVIAAPAQFKDGPVRVSGVARRVCERKGCWMELATGAEPNAESCRVRFENYGFFVPTDSAGSQITLEGKVEVRKVSAGRVRHLENEGAVFASKNEDGSANEVQIVATGVELLRN